MIVSFNKERFVGKRGPKPWQSAEEKLEAARKRAALYRSRHPEKARASVRRSKKERLAAKAIAEGREPGRVGNPKRQTPEERAAYLAEWRQENADKVRARDAAHQRRYRRERAAAEGREFKPWTRYSSEEERIVSQRAKGVVYANRHRALKVDADGSYTAEDIQRLFGLQRGKCVFCLRPLIRNKFEVDHHMPLSRGGSNQIGNLRLLHKKCNTSKGARDPAEHALRNGLLCW
jgi:5-methylcytosine-specific restriction endonuclease McrA